MFTSSFTLCHAIWSTICISRFLIPSINACKHSCCKRSCRAHGHAYISVFTSNFCRLSLLHWLSSLSFAWYTSSKMFIIISHFQDDLSRWEVKRLKFRHVIPLQNHLRFIISSSIILSSRFELFSVDKLWIFSLIQFFKFYLYCDHFITFFFQFCINLFSNIVFFCFL